MEFTKEIMFAQECFISGIYKCVKYDKWGAFFKPVGWVNWGNACERTQTDNSRKYKNLKAAQAACRRHLKKFGTSPKASDKILIA